MVTETCIAKIAIANKLSFKLSYESTSFTERLLANVNTMIRQSQAIKSTLSVTSNVASAVTSC